MLRGIKIFRVLRNRDEEPYGSVLVEIGMVNVRKMLPPPRKMDDCCLHSKIVIWDYFTGFFSIGNHTICKPSLK